MLYNPFDNGFGFVFSLVVFRRLLSLPLPSCVLSTSVANVELEMGNKNGKKIADVGQIHYSVS